MLKLVTLGHIELTRDGAPVLPGRRKLLVVLTYLTRAKGRPVARTQLASLFWPVEDEARGRRSVRQALTDLRRAVGECLVEQEDSVAIARGSIQLDADQLEAAAAGGDYRGVVALWRGDFLAGADDVGGEEFRGWLEAERHGLRSQFGYSAEQLVDDAERRGAWEEGLGITRAWMASLELDERAAARHIGLLALAGRRAEAGGAHASFLQRFRETHGGDPGAEFRELTTRALTSNARVDRPTSPAGKGLLSPDLVAREAEFGTLTGLWQTVAAGGRAVALIEGEDGSGKTRLAEEFLRWTALREPRPLVLQARAFEAEQTRPLVLLRHLLAGLAQAPGLAAAPPATLQTLAAQVPEIAERFPTLPREPSEVAPAEAAARALADVAAEIPLILLVDDAQFADPESREVLESLCRHPADGVFVILTTTPDALPGLGGLERVRAGGGLVRISLPALGEAQIERVLAGMADFIPGDRQRLAARLHAESGGNPLSVIELVTALADRGAIAPGRDGLWALQSALASELLPLPVSVRNAVTIRLRQLPIEATRALQAAAVLGRDADSDTLHGVAGSARGKTDEGLDQLIARRFLRLASDGAHLEFIHEIVRHVVYQGMTPARRERMHRRAWRVLRRDNPPDSSRSDAVTHHHARMGSYPSRRQRWLAAAGVLLAAGVAPAAFLTSRARPPVSPATIAVMPFTVRGNGAYAYLSEGMATLLSAALDGLGGLHAADPPGLLAFAARKPADAALGQATARHFGAGLFVLGDLLETNGRIELAASLYDVAGKPQMVARASAESEAGIYAAVDELAKQLLVSRRAGPAEEINRVAAATTSSLPALKAYLAGERQLRAGNFSAAVDSFQLAVATDSAFALAYYRLAIAAEWDQRAELPTTAAQQAARYASRLTERSRELVEALLAWRNGNLGNARDRYVRILSRYPKDVEAWFQLGEVLFHAGPVLGQSVSEAKAAWLHVLALEPDNLFAVVHLARIAATESDSAGMAALVPRLPDLETTDDRRLLELAAWRALLVHNEAEAARVLSYLPREVPALTTLWQLAGYSRDLAGTEQFVRRWGRPAFTEHLLVQLDLAKGKWRSATAQLTSVSGMDPVRVVSRAYLAALPFVEIPRDELSRVRTQLQVWVPASERVDPDSKHTRLYPEIQRYLLGQLSARLGDLAGGRAHLDALEQMARPTPKGSLERNLSLGLKAVLLRAEGQPAAALAALESVRAASTRDQFADSPLFSLALERYHRAELLQELGRGEAALPWLESMAQLSPLELLFLAPAHLHRAEIYESLGRPADAAAHYARFIELWQDADPESQRLVSRARARLDSLSRKGTGDPR